MFLLASLCALTQASAWAQNIVINGDFENAIPGGRHPSIPGWSRGDIDGDGESQFDNPSAGCGISGSQCLSLGAGSVGATVTQTLTTTANQVYIIDFYIDGSTAGTDYFHLYWGGSEVTGLALANWNSTYAHFYATVVATGASTDLTFLTGATGDAWYIDDVTVTPANFAPVITSISPASGDTSGGDTVTVTGLNLYCIQGVTFNGVTANYSSSSDTSLTVTAPAEAAGMANILITTAEADNGDSTAYTYIHHATTYTLSGPSSGPLNAASSNFTVTPDGVYTGTVTITPSGGGLSTPVVLTFSNSSAAQTFTIAATSTSTVTLTPSNNGSLTNPSALSYLVLASDYTLSGPSGGYVNTPSGAFTVTPDAPYTGAVTVTPSGGGLSAATVLTFSNSAAPQTFAITPLTAGAITLTPSNSGGLTNPANLTYTANAIPAPSLTVNPSSLMFQYQPGTALAGATQQFTVAGSAAASWTAGTDGAPWLALSPSTGIAGGAASVNINPNGLTPGTYTSNITVSSAQGGPGARVLVTLQVLPASALAVTPTAIFTGASEGQPSPSSATLSIATPGALWSVAQAEPAQPWLSLSAASGVAPSTVQVMLDPTKLGGGTYYASLVFTDPGASNSPVVVPVRFVVTTGFSYNAPLANSASLLDSGVSVAPNEIVSLFLPNVACPQTPQLTINGVAASVLAFTAGQINAVFPESVSAGPLTVLCQGSAVWTFNGLTVLPSVPGIFTTSAQGVGQGAILNQDESLNAPANPAPAGSTVSVYATGLGGYLQPAADGLRRIAAEVQATIGGLPATVTYAGEAPGLTLGLTQINLRIPDGVTPGPVVPLAITANGAAAQTGVTLAVR